MGERECLAAGIAERDIFKDNAALGGWQNNGIRLIFDLNRGVNNLKNAVRRGRRLGERCDGTAYYKDRQEQETEIGGEGHQVPNPDAAADHLIAAYPGNVKRTEA